jgi:hypothetical protein
MDGTSRAYTLRITGYFNKRKTEEKKQKEAFQKFYLVFLFVLCPSFIE